MTSAKVNIDGVMLFEQPFARIPYESYRKVFRTSQKHVERELGAVQTVSKDLARRGKDLSKDDAIRSIQGMITRVDNLKRKLSDLYENSGASTQTAMRERFEHLTEVEDCDSTSSPEFSAWADTRLDRWLVDWALRTGREKTARKIAKEKSIESLVDIELFMDIRRIESALAQHSCTEALAWCNENKTALRKIKSTLEFELRLQEYIELARARKEEEAIAYTKKHLVSWQDTHLPQIKQASALLAFPPSTNCGPYKRLYDQSRWSLLIKEFRMAIYNLNTLPTQPLLHLALFAGLASLKLPSCQDPATRNIDCPVCEPELARLAADLPSSHHVNSTIVCRLSGKIMDEDNMPMAFPNGQVYSREALEDMAAKNGGMVTCPQTGSTVDFSVLRKVFVS